MKYLLPFATLFMIACLDSDKADTGEEDETSDFSPSEGLWTLPEPNITADTCGFDEGGEDTGEEDGGEDTGGDDGGDAMITLGENGAFTLLLDPDSEDPQSLACTLDAQNFTCTASEEEAMDGIDAVLTMAMNISGSFSSANEFTGSIGMDVSCTGADCAMLANFGMNLPCSMEGDMEGAFVE
jgi:hypothetical protein